MLIIITLLAFFCICLNYLVVFTKSEDNIKPLKSRVEKEE